MRRFVDTETGFNAEHIEHTRQTMFSCTAVTLTLLLNQKEIMLYADALS